MVIGNYKTHCSIHHHQIERIGQSAERYFHGRGVSSVTRAARCNATCFNTSTSYVYGLIPCTWHVTINPERYPHPRAHLRATEISVLPLHHRALADATAQQTPHIGELATDQLLAQRSIQYGIDVSGSLLRRY